MGNLMLCKIKKPYLTYPKGMIIQLEKELAEQLIKEKIAQAVKPKKNKKASGYLRK